jgi:hypothetical protein
VGKGTRVSTLKACRRKMKLLLRGIRIDKHAPDGKRYYQDEDG